MFCKQCGSELIEGAAFCTECGAPVSKAAAQPTPTPAAQPAPAAQAQPAAQASAAQAPAPQRAPQSNRAQQPASKRKKTPIIVAGAICIVAVIAVACFVALSGGDSKTVKLDASVIPDEAVRTTLAVYDADGDGELSEEEAQSVTELSFDSAQKVTVPKALKNVNKVTVTGSQVNSVDIPSAPELTTLDLTNCAISTIDISGLPALQTIILTGTNITELDVSHNSNLRYIIGGDNVELKGLDKIGLKEYFVPTEITATSQLNNASATLSATYDDQNRISTVNIKSSGTVDWVSSGTTTYSYNDNGQPTGYVMTANGSEIRRVTWTYNDKGQITNAASKYPSSSATLNTMYSYNDKGQLTESDTESTRVISSYASYDANGNIATFTGGATGLTQKDGTTFTYDSNGRLVSFTNSTGNIASGTVSYDANGNCTGIQQTYVQNSTSTANDVVYTYDSNGLITKASAVSGLNGRVYSATDLKYDRFGNLTSLTYSPVASPYTITIKYTRFLCTESNAPLGSIRESTDPLDMSGYLPGNGESSNIYTVWNPVSMATDARDIIFGSQTTRYQKSGQVERMTYVEHKTLEASVTATKITDDSKDKTSTSAGTTISTDLYELTLPASWTDKVTVGEMQHSTSGYSQSIKLKGTDTEVMHIMVDPMGIGGGMTTKQVYNEKGSHSIMIFEYSLSSQSISYLGTSLDESTADPALQLTTNGKVSYSDVKSGTDSSSAVQSYFDEAIKPTIKLK